MSNGSNAQRAPETETTIAADPKKEYVTGGATFWHSRTLHTLPHAIDDVTADFGDDLYDRMMVDPQVAGSINILKAGILEDGVHLSSAVTDADADGYDLAKEIAAFCTTVLDELDIPLDDVLWNLLDALPYGNKIAELVYRQDSRWLVLQAIKVKPRRATAFVVDEFMNVRGLAGQPGLRPNISGVTPTGDGPSLLPLEKFVIMSFRPHDSDPRGSAALRPAYNAWWLKMQTWIEFLKYLSQFASPSVWGTTQPAAKSPPGETRTPQEIMLDQLIRMRNGTVAVFPDGAKLNTIMSTGEGQAFHRAFALYGREIVTAIINQTRAILEAEHGSKADSETSQDVLDTLVRQAKKSVVRKIRRDILRRVVRYNYGEKAIPLTPLASLGDVEEQDRTPMWNAIANLMRAKYLDLSQLMPLDVQAGLPPRQSATLVDGASPDDNAPEEDENEGSAA